MGFADDDDANMMTATHDHSLCEDCDYGRSHLINSKKKAFLCGLRS